MRMRAVKQGLAVVAVVGGLAFTSARAFGPDDSRGTEIRPAAHSNPPPAPAPTASQDSGARSPFTVWYLGHCGFGLRVGDKLLVFDYVPNLGSPPKNPEAGGLDDGFIEAVDLQGMEVFVFASHAHGDHYHPDILAWEEAATDIHYFFAWEVGDDPGHHYMIGPRETAEVNGVRVFTVNSSGDGIPEVAYLVQVEGMWIYHNGDHFSPGTEDLDYLEGITSELDAAFVTGVPMEGNQYFEKEIDFLQRFQPRSVFPMHRGGEEDVHREWAEILTERGLELNVLFPQARGDRFELEG